MAGYDFAAIEKKWQEYWQSNETFRQPNPGEKNFVDRPKLYVLDMFPYPSGAGLHVGHPEGYTATDIVARYARMNGYNVLHPMGYDSFGLPAQQYAVESGIHPKVTTVKNIENMKRQMKAAGFSYDWSRCIATTDVEYYRWTQWIFLQLYNSWFDPEANAARPIKELERKLLSGQLVVDFNGNIIPAVAARRIADIDLYGLQIGQYKFAELEGDQQRRLLDEYRLAYIAEVPVNWCPMLGTVLANEEVTNEGRSDRGDYPVYRRAMKQWMLRITAYAERLLEDLDRLDWPESIKAMQRNWIGRSEGAEVKFEVLGTTGVSPVTSAFKSFADNPGSFFPSLYSPTFEGKNPYPPNEPMDPELIAHARNLPHLEVPGATYFVTYHAVKDEILDDDDRGIVTESCLYWHRKKCCVYALVVMDNHVHMIVRPLEGQSMEKLMHGIKSYTAHEINKKRGRKGSFWIEESFDHIIRDSQWLSSFVQYICNNPIKRGLVSRTDSYPYLWINSEELFVQDSGAPFGYQPFIIEEHRRDACGTQETETIIVYTTRPDTLFGATYMVLAPEHPLTEQVTTPDRKAEVDAYVKAAVNKTELERTVESKEKSGVFTGAFAINPVNKKPIPIWVADYVMMGYGTGAIMAVPAHDTRDFEFATKFNLPIVQVVQPPDGIDWHGYVDDGIAVNSGQYDGLSTAEFKKRITANLEKAGLGKAAVNYKLRDWIFSRQWYWGEPFPIVHCEKCGVVAVPEDRLPVVLPDMEDFSPQASDDPDAPPAPPLGKAKDWAKTACPRCGGPASRELNAMPQWAGSCWYYLRFIDPRNDKVFCGKKLEKYWMTPSKHPTALNSAVGADLYVGGAEHAVLHLLYARFWHKVLYDLGHVSTAEPFGRLFNQGMIRSFAYRDRRGMYVGYNEVDLSGERPRHRTTGEELTESIEKMSKSLKNVVNPDEVVAQYGADTLRLYEMFMGPLESSKPWNTRDVPGVHRFLNRVWRMIAGDDGASMVAGSDNAELRRPLERAIKKVGEDILAMKFNTAIAAMMEFVNAVYKAGSLSTGQAERFLAVLVPFAPHICEELWQKLGHGKSLAYEKWPAYDPALIAEDTIELPVQINGKLRGRISVAADADQETIIAAALAEPKVAAAVEGKTIVKKIVVPGKMVNLVIK